MTPARAVLLFALAGLGVVLFVAGLTALASPRFAPCVELACVDGWTTTRGAFRDCRCSRRARE